MTSEFLTPQYPVEYLLGSVDVAADAAFLGLFGMEPTAQPDIPAEVARGLFGLDRPLRQILMKPVDKPGAVRVIETDTHGAPLKPFELGPVGIDIHTMDLDIAMKAAATLGGTPGAPTPYWVYGEGLIESRILSPRQDYAVHGVQSPKQFLSKAADDSNRRYADFTIHVWFVDFEKTDAEQAFWGGEFGLEVMDSGMRFETPAMKQLMGLPFAATMGGDQYVDAGYTRCLELLYYIDAPGELRPDWPLRSGFHGLTFRVSDLDAVINALPSAEFGTVVSNAQALGAKRCVTGTSPAGVRFQLHEIGE
jgi:hypothetical protein